MALLIAILVGACVWFSGRVAGAKNILTKLSFAWLGLIVMQIGLGTATVWTNKSADIATAHVAFGALSLMGGRQQSRSILDTTKQPVSQKPAAHTRSVWNATRISSPLWRGPGRPVDLR